MSELKPCPFCGSSNVAINAPFGVACYVICRDCGAMTAWGESDEEVNKAWNRRADNGC